MIVNIGLDLIETARIQRAWERFGLKFAGKILTPEELAHIPKNPIPFLAARFAGKEAGVKALGTGFSQGITFHSLTIHSDQNGKPCLSFSGRALQQADALKVTRTHLSLTHARDTACAVVILEKQSE